MRRQSYIKKSSDSEEVRAEKTLEKMLSGVMPVDMLPLTSIDSIFQEVIYPGSRRKTQIIRLAAEGLLTFAKEPDKDGVYWFVIGTKEWGVLWRCIRHSDWSYLRDLDAVHKRQHLKKLYDKGENQ
jgi:hypothetical protein